MSVAATLRRARRDSRGSVAVEFAILAPAVFTMMFGVFQVGLGLQNYNALRNVSAEVARYAMVQYATGNKLTDTQLSSYANALGTSGTYLLKSENLNATVATAATQRVTGVTEKTLTLSYRIPSLLASLGLNGPQLTYSRPLFVCITC
ncbi:MAG: TadE/TadG family type IV pilus assembly protein [Croceibacterium sp.]